MAIDRYRTIIFDCDGVLLQSNDLKTEAFYEIALPYGAAAAQALVAYHQRYGGVSRYKKLEYLLGDILKKKNHQPELDALIGKYGELVRGKLLTCALTDGMQESIESLPRGTITVVISGGQQEELRQVFAARDLDKYFDAIFGSPDSKPEIIRRELDNNTIVPPAAFIGDSEYDYQCARQSGLDFIFMSQYTEFKTWREYFTGKDVGIIENLRELMNYHAQDKPWLNT